MKPITIQRGQKLTTDQAQRLFHDITANEQQGHMETRGPWNIITRYVALCVHTNSITGEKTIYGYRTLSTPRQSGYCLEGYVSIGRKRYSAFTSSELFEIENGHLIDVATIHPPKDKIK